MKKLPLEKQLYVMGAAFFPVMIIPTVIYLRLAEAGRIGDCIFLTVFHLYCPGCGGTRAIRCLLQGHLLQSFWYHPLVLYGAVMYLIFMGSHTLEFLTKGRIHGLRFRAWYLWTALGILVVNLIVKNVLFLGFGISLDHFS